MSNDKPILFNDPMINAILEFRKTQTRRLIKVQPQQFHKLGVKFIECPYGNVSDLLWVRENFAVGKGYDNVSPIDIPEDIYMKIYYTADGEKPPSAGKIRPSIFMPKWMSRLTLEITDIGTQRVNDISEEDAMAEGCPPGKLNDGQEYIKIEPGNIVLSPGAFVTTRGIFKILWGSIHGEDSWEKNPWVWVIKFKPHKNLF